MSQPVKAGFVLTIWGCATSAAPVGGWAENRVKGFDQRFVRADVRDEQTSRHEEVRCRDPLGETPRPSAERSEPSGWNASDYAARSADDAYLSDVDAVRPQHHAFIWMVFNATQDCLVPVSSL